MQTRTTWLICSLLAIPGAEVLAADNPWVGTWTLDPGKSHLTGDTFSFSKGPGKLLHYADGSVDYDFGIDGKDYRSLANRTVSWSTAGQNAWDAVHKIEGKVHAREHHELSADGRTLTITTAGTWPDGSTFHSESVYQRVTGTDGLVGTWRSVKATSGGPPHFIISSPAPGVLRYELPDSQQSVEGRADGSDHPITGPTAPPGFTSAFKLVSPTKLTYVLKIDGKPIGYGVQTLAPDGRTFTDVTWNPGKESEKLTSVYLKQ
jgi:hypothetical protein